MEMIFDAFIGICVILFWGACLLIALAGIYLVSAVLLSLLYVAVTVLLRRIQLQTKRSIQSKFQLHRAVMPLSQKEAEVAVSIVGQEYLDTLLQNPVFLMLFTLRNRLDSSGMILVSRNRPTNTLQF